MHLDACKYPLNYHFAAVAGEQLGLYVKVANFTENNGRRMFRMIVDAELDRKQLRELLFSTIKDALGTYEFSHIDVLSGPVVDSVEQRTSSQQYLRITF